MTTAARKNNRRELVGFVVSDKMDKTCVVQIERLLKHSKYNRLVKRRKKFKVHDENNQAQEGDKVRIGETRPLSKEKRFRLLEVLEKAKK